VIAPADLELSELEEFRIELGTAAGAGLPS
jgi:hypothetical protein